MKKISPLTELSKWIKEKKEIAIRDNKKGGCDYYVIRIHEIIEAKINSLIESEKEQIGLAYQQGLLDCMNHFHKDYYNRNYGK